MSETAERTIRRSTVAGIACGAGAGALWGLVFLAPELVSGISPVQLTIGRYLAYGLLSLALILPVWRKLRDRVDKRDWINLALLAFFGNIFYYILLSAAVQTGGIALTSLVIGFMPV
ncbi:MAG: EamA family transporter, partial [Asticcacaulis sp.]